MKRTKVLITAGGTATAWHMSNIINTYFADRIELHIADINPPELIAASKLADVFHQVLPLADKGYKKSMLELLEGETIDYIVPLIDQDLFIFPEDDEDLSAIGVKSTGPKRQSVQILSDKREMEKFLRKNHIYTPKVVAEDETDWDAFYAVKPRIGCGSKGFRIMSGADIFKEFVSEQTNNVIIQELCDKGGQEITAEVFHADGRLRVFPRVRIETKEGVCTKMRPVREPEIEESIARLVDAIPMPRAFCVQFMKHKDHWNVVDCNLRIGAGTALATAGGFQLTRAFFASILNETIEDEWFSVDPEIKAVVRVYREEVMR